MAKRIMYCKCNNEMIQMRNGSYSEQTFDEEMQLIYWCDKCGSIFETNVEEEDSSENPKGTWYMI